jgi:ketosteroid isomerase-like protein
MSANLKLVKGIFARWEQGDFSNVDWADSEIELVVRDGTSPGEWKGTAGMAAAWREVLNAYDELRAIADSYRELDRDRILVLIRNTGRGKASGMDVAEMHPRSANLFELREGKVARLTLWWDRDLALAELGIEES